MNKKISAALISVFYKEGLEPVVKQLKELGITMYSTGGTQKFIEESGIEVIPVESLTSYPSILGGRVKTLHPSVFGGILGRRDNETDVLEMQEYNIPAIDLVIVDLYPFEETVTQTSLPSFEGGEEKAGQMIIEKIDIGGPSMIRAAAKNFKEVTVIASKDDYEILITLLKQQEGVTTLEQRKEFATKAFEIVMNYDIAISSYFTKQLYHFHSKPVARTLRYGENPHQKAEIHGDLESIFTQLHGKELSYNNLADVDAAIQLISEFDDTSFGVIKHTNVCGISSRESVLASWKDALAGDPESAFGGVLICNKEIDEASAKEINEIFFEVLLAPSFTEAALTILQSKKNRILLQLKKNKFIQKHQVKNLLVGMIKQDTDEGNYIKWVEAGGRETTITEKKDLIFANLVCKHLKSNAIALVKNKQLIGKGCGQTSRIDALRQAIEKAAQFNFDLAGAVMASDAFFPFNDCVKMGHEAGITAFIQPGGSIRDKDSIEYCRQNNLAMVLTGMRHFRH